VPARFSVDTHLFEELCARLVGRDSKALIELIKNAYDADATLARVYGEQLADPDRGFILVEDDGSGMTLDDFVSGYLRIASGSKRGDRYSGHFKRRYTGEKGIGRLAAHKLARMLDVDSIPRAGGAAVRGHIDWDRVESYQTLDEVGADALSVNETGLSRETQPGTVVRLSRLRRRWTEPQLAQFVGGVQILQPPPLLVDELPDDLGVDDFLFESPVVRDADLDAGPSGKAGRTEVPTDPGFQLILDGDFSIGDNYWAELGERINWLIEIQSRADGVEYLTASTRRTGVEKSERARIDHPRPELGPFFDARILVREGRLSGNLRQFGQLVSGVKVYMEGFRVAPYGERGNDWLDLDSDYARRSDRLGLLDELAVDAAREGLSLLPNASYLGGVFLVERYAPDLRMLVNREGFVPDAGYDVLRDLVKRALQFNARARSAISRRDREKRSLQRAVKDRADTSSSLFGSERALVEQLKYATGVAHEARSAVAARDQERTETAVTELATSLERANELTAEAISERALLQVLASVGTQMAAFIHEVEGLVGLAQTVERALGRLAHDHPGLARRLGEVHSAVSDIRYRVERQATYLTDVISVDARRRRTRLSLRERFEAASNLVDPAASRRGIEISNDIPEGLRSPPMFSAELTAVFSNLLTNAVKAAGDGGRVAATAERDEVSRSVVVRIQNTGVRVASGDEKWFRPFESTTVREIDPVLGQGMGLGLPITRSILEDYRATIRFAEAEQGFETAIEVRFP
jgi:signal transduction histidine kinase